MSTRRAPSCSVVDPRVARAGPEDDVFLVVTHKAVEHLSVLVYDIATESYYREQMEEVRAYVCPARPRLSMSGQSNCKPSDHGTGRCPAPSAPSRCSFPSWTPYFASIGMVTESCVLSLALLPAPRLTPGGHGHRPGGPGPHRPPGAAAGARTPARAAGPHAHRPAAAQGKEGGRENNGERWALEFYKGWEQRGTTGISKAG